MEYANALKFINSYNRIEAQLKLMYRTKPTQNFTDLVKRCSDQNLTVRRYAAELTDYGKLRNAIVHRHHGAAISLSPIRATRWWNPSPPSKNKSVRRRA